MKSFKYILLFLAFFVIAVIISFSFFKIKNNKDVVVFSPIAETTTQKTSSFSLENAPTESLKGKITTMEGEINWQGRIATEPAKLSSPVAIQQGEKLITGEKSNLSLVFPDACLVEFSEKTEVDVIQTLPANIVFSQISGTGEYIKMGSYPVSIRIVNLLVEEDGDMVVFIDPEEPIVTLTIKSGKAIVAYNDSDFISREVALVDGQTFIFNYDTRIGDLK
ncbi:hypothetical protein COT62_00255 [Candidatus Roizmanbacteria bacterium CG09_land_8_20_14_0_10_41_9]|uniref:FecR protein domain-containing protein n=1 Tax=Candidatus Roizmanbacteria bacterium CG09_land_8_20_14_0_10_41_9 TaxID=1974850 RepID=A0A2H0WTZ9_9BACT|nr:MAG: hypothetical protein COT62_00255 [Candidatus Roizmanbacteria bacterium CG09_land_8_20_14_0_10_41_9]